MSLSKLSRRRIKPARPPLAAPQPLPWSVRWNVEYMVSSKTTAVEIADAIERRSGLRFATPDVLKRERPPRPMARERALWIEAEALILHRRSRCAACWEPLPPPPAGFVTQEGSFCSVRCADIGRWRCAITGRWTCDHSSRLVCKGTRTRLDRPDTPEEALVAHCFCACHAVPLELPPGNEDPTT